MSQGLIFVYGSLRGDAPAGSRPRAGAEAQALLAAGADLVGAATMAGKLYAVAWYPGFAPGRGGKVHGEVWRMRDARGTLAALDEYEGAEYARERRSAKLADGSRVTAWVYRFTGDAERALPIASGDFLDWVREKELA
jgi:gamma-glutamylcyclotransferase (GGCT)/AIG2-like uncharacterized protein YtfP